MLPETKKSTAIYYPNKEKYGYNHYPDKDPDIYLNDFFRTKYIAAAFTNLFSTLYSGYKKYHQDQIREILLNSFHFQEREEFSKDLWRYTFKIVERELYFHGKESDEELDMSMIRRVYVPKLVEFMKLFLRNHLIRQEEFTTLQEYEEAVNRNYGYYFLDIAFHEFAIGMTLPLSGWVKTFEQDPIEIYGVQNAIMGIEDDNGEEYDFEIDKGNYRKFKKKALRDIGCRTFFTFKVTKVVDLNHAQGKIMYLL
jgi:hypothetical protein